MKVKFNDLRRAHDEISGKLHDVFTEVLNDSNFVMGKYLRQFEEEWACYCQTRFAVGVASGLDAIHLALRAMNVGPGDEVVVPAHTFIATALAVVHSGAKPVFIDSDPETNNLDVKLLSDVITAKTKAIIPVHLYGRPCPMAEIMSIAERYDLLVIEDNAQAQGAGVDGKKTGSWGHASATSFYPIKNLGCLGDGGAITTNNQDLRDRLIRLRNYGSIIKYCHEVVGFNSRLDELQAALLSVKLRYLDGWNCERRRLAERYTERLTGVGDLKLPTMSGVFHLYVIKTTLRQELRLWLEEQGIATVIHYQTPCHLQPVFTQLSPRYPCAESICNTCLSLPLFPGLTTEEQDCVIEKVVEFYEKVAYSRG